MKLLCVDLFCGLGGWTEGFLAEGYTCIGFDIERHDYGSGGYPGQLVLQDILTLHGSQFKDASVIVASPPCQAYSHRAMPWNKDWRMYHRWDDDGGPATDHDGPKQIFNDLFWACFRIQREACEVAGHHIPMIVENVRGAIPWVGQSRWHYGSFHLWGDVPALMPMTRSQDEHYFGLKLPGNNSPRRWEDREIKRLADATKTVGHANQRDGYSHTRHLTNQAESEAVKGMSGLRGMSHPTDSHPRDLGGPNDPRRFSSKSNARKAASAQIAKIPLRLNRWIERCFKNQ